MLRRGAPVLPPPPPRSAPRASAAAVARAAAASKAAAEADALADVCVAQRTPQQDVALAAAPSLVVTSSTWGPPLWDALFSVACRTRRPDAMAGALRLLDAALPCGACQASCREFATRSPVPALAPAPAAAPAAAAPAAPAAAAAAASAGSAGSAADAHAKLARDRDALARWLWACKDNVNRKLGKPHVPYAAVRAKYTHFRALTSDAALLDLACTLVLYAPSWPTAPHATTTPAAVAFVCALAEAGRGVVFEEALCDRLCEVIGDAQAMHTRDAALEGLRGVAAWFYGAADEGATRQEAPT